MVVVTTMSSEYTPEIKGGNKVENEDTHTSFIPTGRTDSTSGKVKRAKPNGIKAFHFLTALPPRTVDVFLPDMELSVQTVSTAVDVLPEFFPIIVTFCPSPEKFYWSFLKYQTRLTRLMTDMSLFYSSPYATNAYAMKPSHCYPGQVVAVQSAHGHWYRAKIVRLVVAQPSAVAVAADVFYVDFGLSDRANLLNVRHLQINFTLLPVQGILGHVVGIAHPAQRDISGYSPEAIDSFLSHMRQGVPTVYTVAANHVRIADSPQSHREKQQQQQQKQTVLYSEDGQHDYGLVFVMN